MSFCKHGKACICEECGPLLQITFDHEAIAQKIADALRPVVEHATKEIVRIAIEHMDRGAMDADTHKR